MNSIFEYVDFSQKSPFSKETESIVIRFDGSIYNKSSLIEELKIDLKTSDLDLIHHLYKSFDTDIFKKLDGIFSLTIQDNEKNMLYLGRDRAGIYPMYFYDSKQTLMYGTSLKEFYKLPTFSKKISKKGLAIYLNYGFILQPFTIFEDTYKVKAGHFAAFNLKNRIWQQRKYWSLEDCYTSKKSQLLEDDVINSVEDILTDSIKKRLYSSQNFASSLSGGYDSSIVASLLTRNCEKKLDTFTIGFSQEEINEAKDAKKIADFLNTNHHEHYFSDQDALNIVPKLSDVYDEPFADYGATPTVLMSKLVRDNGFDTLFVGDGGDEVFATADDVARFDKLLKRPAILKKGLYQLLNIIDPLKIPLLKSYQNFPTKYYKFLQLLNAQKISQMVKIKPVLFFDAEIKRLLKDENIDTTTDEIDFPKYSESVDQIIGSYFKTSMVDAELVKSFQASRYSNLSIKEPLLDIELVEYMTKISGELKIKDGQKKYILKQIAHKHIPKDLLDRPKSGFDIPFSVWLKGSLKELLYAHINEERLKNDGIFDVVSVIEIRDAFYRGNESYKYKLWTLFLFQLWFHKVFANMNDM
jgi:asparagine synthase (glutamine-hydrolysing)